MSIAKVRSVGIYVRISTDLQSGDMQRQELVAYAEARGWQVHQVYEDTATGTNDRRANFKRCLADAAARKFSVLLCWKLDRAFRSLKDCVVHLQSLTEQGVEFVALRDQIDLSTSAGRLMTHLLASFAEFEADLIRSRVKAGIAHRRAQGKQWGRSPRLDFATAKGLLARGLSIRQIANETGLTKSAVSKSLRKLGLQPIGKTRSKLGK